MTELLLPEMALQLLDDGDADGARALVRGALAAVPLVDPRGWAWVAESAGLSAEALGAWQAVLAEEGEDRDALEHLAHLHEARGDRARAEACLRRLAPRPEAPRPEPSEPEPDPGPGEPGDGDLVRFVHLFGGRLGVHARQWSDGQRGGWSPVATPLTPELVHTHLEGGVTLGSYLVRHDDTVQQLVFDLDATKSAVEAAWGDRERAADLRRVIHATGLDLLAALRARGLDPILVDSGFKGRHLWCMLPEPAPAGRARAVGLALAAAMTPADPRLHIEVFPKQGHVAPGGLGNLVKLPLGIHRRTDRRCSLLDDAGRPLPDPWARLRDVRTVGLDTIEVPSLGASAPPPASSEPPEISIEAPVFTEADFEARPRLAAILGGCPVLRAIVEEVLEEAHLDHQARLVVEHTLGHLPEGVDAIDYLLDRVGAPVEGRMKSPHRGSPMSCRRVRQRVPGTAGRVACTCPLDSADSYPHPLLHGRGVPGELTEPEDARPTEAILDSLRLLEVRHRRILSELAALRRAAATRLSRLPEGRLDLPEGSWCVEDHEGVPAIAFQPRAEP